MTDEQERTSIRPWEWLVLVAIALVYALLRIPLFTHPGRLLGWNSDAALIGLIARAMRDGLDLPVYFWGQFYLGTFTSLVTVVTGAFVGIGPIALRLAAALEIAVGMFVFWLAIRHVFGRAAAALATFWLAAGPSFFFHSVIAPIGAEQLFLVAAVLFWMATRTTRDSAWFVIGLIVGFGAWVHQGIAFMAFAIAIASLIHDRFRWRIVVYGSLGVAIGYLPAAISLLRDDPLLYRRIIPTWNVVRVFENFLATSRNDLWLLLADDSLTGIVTGACIIVGSVVALYRAPRTRAWIIIAGTIAISAAFWYLSTYPYGGAVRYVTPVVPLVYAAAAAGIGKWWAAGKQRRVAAIGVAIFISLGLYVPRAQQVHAVVSGNYERYTEWPGFFDPRPVLAQLERDGYEVCYAEVWVAHKYEWLTSPTVRFVPVRSVHRTLNQSLALIRRPGRKCFVDNYGNITALTRAQEAYWAGTVIERARKAGIAGPRD